MCNTKKKIYSIQATYTSPRFTSLKTPLPSVPVELHKTKQLPSVGKEYLYFQINSKSPHATQCVKSRILNKSIDFILSIEKFEQQII